LNPFKKPPSRLRIFFVMAVVFMLNIVGWSAINLAREGEAWDGVMNGVSFTPYRDDHNPSKNSFPTREEIAEDVRTIAPYVKSIRTYGATNGLETIPDVARKYGLWVTMGAWYGITPRDNLTELNSLIAVANASRNVNRVLIGNEAILRGDINVDDMVDMLRWVRHRLHPRIKISTAEPWHVWLKNPRLVSAVDYITVHTLPYWEGKPVNEAVAYALQRYDEVRKAFPNKTVIIGEIGWPSAGQWIYGAEPSQVNQARFIREFLSIATERKLDYYIVEAFDQAWKWEIEGSVGANWGVWNKARMAKFPLLGKISERRNWPQVCLIAMLFAFLPMLLFLRKAGHLSLTGQIFYGLLIQAIVSILVWSILSIGGQTYSPAMSFAWAGLMLFQFFLFALLLVDGLEFAETMWTSNWRRQADLNVKADAPAGPKVSIHIPCYNEPPQMVIDTLNAIVAMDYGNYEVLVVDNNTKDDAVWKPVEAYCATLGERFRFFHLPSWPGYKAGALNFAMQQTAADADIIAVIDSDYQVDRDWLTSLIPQFENEKIGFVQSPQDYRDWHGDAFKTMCHWEYAGFFHIGMVTRNERNAIIQHGTMTLIRKTALQEVNGWAEWCICEDAELGLRLFEHKYESLYLNRSFGKGLIPDSFQGYKSQRFRWAYGAMQIMKRHWPFFGFGRKELTLAQKYHFIAGWLPWVADAANLVFVAGSLLWSFLLFAEWVEFPPEIFLVPTLAAFAFKIVAGFWMYAQRIRVGWRERIGAAIAGMGLSHVVGTSMLQGLFTSGKPFFRTPKCEDRPALYRGFAMARDELLILLALILCANGLVFKYSLANKQAVLWAGMLLVQSLPYVSAVILSFINVWPRKVLPQRVTLGQLPP
jgi:exo-beta-1,3-glucanase (GH17 family)/cellulose synthase/poly-beta-1,6-N-acetylglucosamine synthase-like glycosyltransferase